MKEEKQDKNIDEVDNNYVENMQEDENYSEE